MFSRLILFCSLFFFCIDIFAELADPTQPTQAFSSALFSGKSEEGLQLDAILYTTQNPVVVINGNILHLNDSIGKYTITQIQRQSVVLSSQEGKVLNLSIDALEVKKPHR